MAEWALCPLLKRLKKNYSDDGWARCGFVSKEMAEIRDGVEVRYLSGQNGVRNVSLTVRCGKLWGWSG
ncbi:MAG: hypothetical protein U0401_32740 [Anaerolineae bacterium]